jgi:hypothetical protein
MGGSIDLNNIFAVLVQILAFICIMGFILLDVSQNLRLTFPWLNGVLWYVAVLFVLVLFLWGFVNMMQFRRCSKCGKLLGPLSTIIKFDDGSVMCLPCLAKLKQDAKRENKTVFEIKGDLDFEGRVIKYRGEDSVICLDKEFVLVWGRMRCEAMRISLKQIYSYEVYGKTPEVLPNFLRTAVGIVNLPKIRVEYKSVSGKKAWFEFSIPAILERRNMERLEEYLKKNVKKQKRV